MWNRKYHTIQTASPTFSTFFEERQRCVSQNTRSWFIREVLPWIPSVQQCFHRTVREDYFIRCTRDNTKVKKKILPGHALPRHCSFINYCSRQRLWCELPHGLCILTGKAKTHHNYVWDRRWCASRRYLEVINSIK